MFRPKSLQSHDVWLVCLDLTITDNYLKHHQQMTVNSHLSI